MLHKASGLAVIVMLLTGSVAARADHLAHRDWHEPSIRLGIDLVWGAPYYAWASPPVIWAPYGYRYPPVIHHPRYRHAPPRRHWKAHHHGWRDTPRHDRRHDHRDDGHHRGRRGR